MYKRQVLGGRKLNFIVLQHMEPDHASMLQDVMYRYPEAIPVCNSKTAGMVKQFTGLDITEKAYIVEEGGMLNTGRHASVSYTHLDVYKRQPLAYVR